MPTPHPSESARTSVAPRCQTPDGCSTHHRKYWGISADDGSMSTVFGKMIAMAASSNRTAVLQIPIAV
jgi:hypothetical protein